jgi:2-polyprenyl-6-methoxyphenol hydroxylase-like FAD-dependent oxidoreductase
VHTQVLVVGAGPTGLAFAALGLRLGLAVRLIEKKSGPSITSKAIGSQYRVSEILACMGTEQCDIRAISPASHWREPSPAILTHPMAGYSAVSIRSCH